MKSLVCIFVFVVLLLSAGNSRAAYSSNFTYVYGSTSAHNPTNAGNGGMGVDYITITKPDAAAFSDTFNLTGFSDVTAATISITHNGNFDTVQPNGYGELWQTVLNGTPMYTLSNSFYDWTKGTIISGWQTDTFTLNAAALASLNSGSSSPQVRISFNDPTLGSNSFIVNSITVSAIGNPSPVPLPAALSLFAPGLLALIAFRRRFA